MELFLHYIFYVIINSFLMFPIEVRFTPSMDWLIGFCDPEMFSNADAFGFSSSLIPDIFTNFRKQSGLLSFRDNCFQFHDWEKFYFLIWKT